MKWIISTSPMNPTILYIVVACAFTGFILGLWVKARSLNRGNIKLNRVFGRMVTFFLLLMIVASVLIYFGQD
ncbi:MAG: hypothetical protein JW861_06050 [Bacteroidales bacterium]|nr:hypothetical protein [Bacteroidales bacterium]